MKRLIAAIGALILLVSLSPVSTGAQISAGKPCKKANFTKTVGKVTFLCASSGGKLTWRSTAPKKNSPQSTKSGDQGSKNFAIGWICDGVADAKGAKDAKGVEIVCVQGSDGKYAWASREEIERAKTDPASTNESKPTDVTPADGKPCTTPGAEAVTSQGIELTCGLGVDGKKFWFAGDQTPRAPLFGNANVRASMTTFPRPQINKCQPEPGQEYQFYRTGKSFVIDPFDSNHYFVTVERLGFFESFDAGATWIPASTEGLLFDMKKVDNTACFKEIQHITFDPSTKGRVYLHFGGTGTVNAKKWQARGAGLYVSNDSGKNWEFLTKPNMHSSVGYLAIDPKDPKILYMGTSSSPLSSTESDLGEVFVSVGLIYKSTDGGQNWTELNTGWGKHTRAYFVRVDPNDSNRVMMAVFQTPLGQDPNNKSASGTNLSPGFYLSNDAGVSWSPLGSSAAHKLSVYNITVSADGKGIIFSPQQTGISTSYWSEDGGQTFTPTTGLDLMLPAFVPDSNRIAYAILEKGPTNSSDQLMRTTDGGRNWSFWSNTPAEMQFSLPDTLTRQQARPQQIVFDPKDPKVMFINGAGGKIAKSTDAGLTWKLLTTWQTFPEMRVVTR